MTTTLTACVLVPQLLVQLAVQQLGVGSPFAVASDLAPHAPILDCCTMARRAGVASGMRVVAAQQGCPQLHVVTIAPSIVDTARATIEAVLHQWGDEVVRWTSSGWLLPLHALGVNYRHATQVGTQLQHELTDATGLDLVLGLAPTRIVAQIAAQEAAVRGERQPVLVLPGAEAVFLAPIPLERMPLVGARTQEQLARLGITTIGQFAALPVTTAVQALGGRGALLHQQAQGIDVVRASIDTARLESSWHYAAKPCADSQQLHRHVQRLTERVGRWLRARSEAAGSITVATRWDDGRQQHRTERFRSRADLDRELADGSHTALRWLLQHCRLAVREVTVRLGDLGPRQQSLFDADPRRMERQQALDQIKHRHGTSAILFAWMLRSP